ncbi:unnamed protein product [Tuber aestivum]|uniref:DUF7025 domain-containing protein n=1 Tax=Tuber aestivum TaxID=59557 RepID=A0A292Q2N8_9PEZI|nr:unnamed protein product [Tuber aestivum]
MPFCVLATVKPNLLFNYLLQFANELSKARPVPEGQRNKTLTSHLTLFHDYISAEYASTIKRLYPLLQHHEITFDLLWALFLPKTLIYTICAASRQPRFPELNWDRGESPQLDCPYVDYGGKTYGEAGALLEIDEFRGPRGIDSLGVFPLAYHEDEEDVRERLIERGGKFGSLKDMHYRYYEGLAFFKCKRGVVKDALWLTRASLEGSIPLLDGSRKRVLPPHTSPVNADDSENENEDEGEIYGSSSIVKLGRGIVAAAVKRTIWTNPRRSYILGPHRKIKLVGATLDATKKKFVEAGKTAEGIKDALFPEEMTEEQFLLCSPTVLGFTFGISYGVSYAID